MALSNRVYVGVRGCSMYLVWARVEDPPDAPPPAVTMRDTRYYPRTRCSHRRKSKPLDETINARCKTQERSAAGARVTDRLNIGFRSTRPINRAISRDIKSNSHFVHHKTRNNLINKYRNMEFALKSRINHGQFVAQNWFTGRAGERSSAATETDLSLSQCQSVTETRHSRSQPAGALGHSSRSIGENRIVQPALGFEACLPWPIYERVVKAGF
ncbi:hypothetical protein J6590_012270 [Homalodisca vitripennis]|nr:hypothetical protein J6590_012270 [Homalodisca vitripennis]